MSTQRCIIHREIGIDCGHRVPDHGSKCRNPHGHRYTIIATCEGPVMAQDGNEENGMVCDFGNLKKYMMDLLDAVFDHGFVIYHKDEAMMNMYFPGQDHKEVSNDFYVEWELQRARYITTVAGNAELAGYEPLTGPLSLPRTMFSVQDPEGMKVIVVNYVPTAENLAKHMYDMLKPVISAHYGNDIIKLVNIRLYETPNGSVDYPGTMFNL